MFVCAHVNECVRASILVGGEDVYTEKHKPHIIHPLFFDWVTSINILSAPYIHKSVDPVLPGRLPSQTPRISTMSSPPHPADSLLEELNSYIRYRKRIAHKFARRRSLSLHCELNRLRRLVDEKRHELGQLLGSSAATSATATTPPPSAHEMVMMMRLEQESQSNSLSSSSSSSSYAPSPRRTRRHSESMLGDLVMIINQWNDMIVDSKEGLDQGWDVAGHSDAAPSNSESREDDTSQASVEMATEATEATTTHTTQRLSMFQRVKIICERVFCKMVADSMDDLQ